MKITKIGSLISNEWYGYCDICGSEAIGTREEMKGISFLKKDEEFYCWLECPVCDEKMLFTSKRIENEK